MKFLPLLKTCIKALVRNPMRAALTILGIIIGIAAIITIVSTIRGTNEQIKQNLIAQLTAPVRWTQSVQNMIADGATEFISVGPGSVLSGLISKIRRDVTCENKQ